MSKPSITKWAVAATAATASLLLPVAAMGASVGGLGARPAHFNPNIPATRAYFVRSVARGASFADQVIVTNGSARVIDVRVDAVDGLTAVTSGAVYANRQDAKHATGRWVRPAVTMVHVPAHGQVSVAFVVRVPARAASGDHLAGLAFEDAHPQRSKGGFSVREVVRVVVGVELQVHGPVKERLSLSGVALKPIPGTRYPSVVIGLRNVGAKLCKPRLAVTLAGPRGSQRVVRQLDTILPGDAIPYPFPWPRTLNAGRYTAKVQATRCGPEAATVGVANLGTALTGTAANPFGPKPPKDSGNGWMPLALVGLVGLLGLGAGFLLSRGRQLLRRTPKTSRT
jgi:hypothetical protein